MTVSKHGFRYMDSSFKAGLSLFGWQFEGWDEIIWVAVLWLVRHFRSELL